MTTTAAINDPNKNLDVEAVFMDISYMLNTSKNYTPRDKQEIIAQKDFWLAIPGLINAKDKDGKEVTVMVKAGVSAKKQMVLVINLFTISLQLAEIKVI